MNNRFWWLLFALAIALSGLNYADGQSVTLAPAPQFTSFLQNGQPNAFGCVFTFNSGTSTPLGTWTDYTGSVSNPNPTVLTAGGTANIWFSDGLLYRVIVKTSGGTNCSSGATVYTADGVNSSLLNTANEWFSTQTFDQPLHLLASDIQIVFGSPSGTQTTLDIPPTSANFILHGPTITANDTLLSQNATQPVQNKNFTTGTQVNGCGMTNGPGTYICIPNNASTATVLNGLAVLSGATATQAPVNSNGAIVGIVTAGAGITGNATIQQSGTAVCLFDGSTVAGDYVQASATVGYECHDSGSSTTVIGSNVGIALSTNSGGAGTYAILLTTGSPYRLLSTNVTQVNSNVSTTNQQPLMTYAFAALSLNAVGKSFRLTTNATAQPGSSIGSAISFGAGTTSGLGLPSPIASQGANTNGWGVSSEITCTVQTSGVSGSLFCTLVSEVGGNAGSAPAVSSFQPLISVAPINFTAPLYVGISCSFSNASSANSCAQNLMLVEQLN